MVDIPVTGLTLSHFCACPMSCVLVFIMFNDLRSEVILFCWYWWNFWQYFPSIMVYGKTWNDKVICLRQPPSNMEAPLDVVWFFVNGWTSCWNMNGVFSFDLFMIYISECKQQLRNYEIIHADTRYCTF